MTSERRVRAHISPHDAFATLIFRRLMRQAHHFAPPSDIAAFVDSALARGDSHPLFERLKAESTLIEDKLFQTHPYRKHANIPHALLAARRAFLIERARVILAACSYFRTRLPIVIILHQVQLYAHRLLDAAKRDAVADTKPEHLAYVAINETTDYVRKWRRPNRIALVEHLCAGVQSAVLRLTAPDLANASGWGLFVDYVREQDAGLVPLAEAVAGLEIYEPGETPNSLARSLGVSADQLPEMRRRLGNLVEKFRLLYEEWQ